MNQVERQFNFDIQLFAEEGAQDIAPVSAEGTTETAPAEAAAPAQADSAPEPGKHISEMTDEEQTEYIKKHFLNEGGRPKKEEQSQEQPGQEAGQPEQAQEQEPTFEITVQGQKRSVTQSELIELAQKGEDYTRKTQALAQQRRELEAQVAQFQQSQQGQQRQQAQQVNPMERAQSDYKLAVGAACNQLGIAPEDFNQFDPVHAFALQQVIVQANMRMGQQVSERRAVEREVQSFAREIDKDPLRQEVADKFEEHLLRRMLDPSQGAATQRAVMAYGRFVNNQATLDDCRVLKEHWAYVKGQLQKEKTPPAVPPKPPVNPPRTEAPGVGRSSASGSVMDVHKLRDLSADPDRQMAYMKSLGIFND